MAKVKGNGQETTVLDSTNLDLGPLEEGYMNPGEEFSPDLEHPNDESSETDSKESGQESTSPKLEPQKGGVSNRFRFSVAPANRVERFIKMMIYGPYGVGKTHLATISTGDVEAMSKVFVVSAESGDLTFNHREDIHVARISSFKQMADIYEWLQLHSQAALAQDYKRLARLQEQVTGVLPMKKSEINIFQTVVIDSLTEVYAYCMYQLLGIDIKKADLELEPENPTEEWNKAGNMIRLLVRSFRDLPMHVIFVCAEQTKEDEKKRQIFSPSIPGKLSKDVQGFLDIVGYLRAKDADETGKRKRRMFIAPGHNFDAKNRVRAWNGQNFLDEPDMSQVLEAIYNNK